jgi:DNA-binding NarL/FixJ family response regulator
MRYPRVLVCEHGGRIAASFRELPLDPKVWTVHEPRRLEDCVEHLREPGPAVVILKLSRDLQQELELLERVNWWFPETACLVVSDTDNPALVGLAWDLGARYVLAPPQSCDLLPKLAAAFLGVPLQTRNP